MVVLRNVEADHITLMSAVNLLSSDNFSAFVLKWTLQEGNFALPECCCHPEIGLLVEECDIVNFLRAKIDHVLEGLVVDDTA